MEKFERGARRTGSWGPVAKKEIRTVEWSTWAGIKSAGRPVLLDPFKKFLLRVAARSSQQEVRWHLAQVTPRLPLTRREILAVFLTLRGYLEDRSVIVRVFALQAMFELYLREPSLRIPVKALVESFCRTGTPAMRARGRKLLSLLKEEKDGL